VDDVGEIAALLPLLLVAFNFDFGVVEPVPARALGDPEAVDFGVVEPVPGNAAAAPLGVLEPAPFVAVDVRFTGALGGIRRAGRKTHTSKLCSVCVNG